jgi:glycosyltransferase involved in cell wall biosynthesis
MESRCVFILTSGSGSLDLYAQRLAEHLLADTLVIDVGRRSGDGFNQPLVSTRTLARLRTDWQIVGRLRRAGSLVHLPNHHLARYGPFLSSSYVVTVHDLIRWFDRRAEAPLINAPNTRDRLHLKLDLGGIRRADAVIAVSHATKRDLVAAGVEAARISVVHSGVDHGRFRPVAGRPIEDPYVLFVGSEQPRKNLAALLAAFAQLRSDAHFSRLRLVKVGPPGGREAAFRKETLAAARRLGIERDILFTGWVADHELPRYYTAAECFVLPSLYEGFGLPAVEAMACGCPVVISSAAALVEVCGDAAITVDASDSAALAGAIGAIATNSRLRRELRARGLRRATAFSWSHTARETERVYAKALCAGDNRGAARGRARSATRSRTCAGADADARRTRSPPARRAA